MWIFIQVRVSNSNAAADKTWAPDADSPTNQNKRGGEIFVGSHGRFYIADWKEMHRNNNNIVHHDMCEIFSPAA